MLMPAPIEAASPTVKASWLLLVAKAAAKTGARVETEPSIRPASPGCTICRTKSRRLASSSLAFTSGGSFSAFEVFGALLVKALFLSKVVEELADVRVLRLRRCTFVEAAGLDFHGGRVIANGIERRAVDRATLDGG